MTRLTIVFSSLVLLMACKPADDVKAGERPASYGLGHAPTPAEIAAIDIDANPSGVGLPAGQGTATTGAVLYAQKCAACHGPKGEGIDRNPKLVGKEPPAGTAFAADFKQPKTIGNYWPYATTLYDYIHRTMPLTSPNSLTPDEVYGLVAFLLTENGIIPPGTTVDAKSLSAIKMPAQKQFVTDNRTGGATFK
ncbi:MAG: c-type cytochrome [Gemmatimonadaceae bacterium]